MDNVNKIKSDPRLRKFDEKTTFWELLRYKYLTFYFFKRVCWAIFRLVLLIGISYVVLFPYIAKIAGSFMSREDFVDVMVKLIPKYPTLDTYKAIINDNEYFKALFNTTTLSLLCGVAQMLTCAVVGYGLSKFKFRGRNILYDGHSARNAANVPVYEVPLLRHLGYLRLYCQDLRPLNRGDAGHRQSAEYLLAAGDSVLHRLGIQERSVHLHYAPVLQGRSRRA